ncbi:MAG: formimidoylglutamate deiminase [Phycisphaerales bacterium]|nr:formimidoylglutamate deiminase [Phycisphaerales bacterium]
MGSTETVRLLLPELVWRDERFESGMAVELRDDGRIGRIVEASALGPEGRQATRLSGRALLPGFSNAHSHAFQRGLRGHGERYPQGAGSFWTWREAMYRLVDSLDASNAYRLSRLAFDEMLGAGFTSVGEFHYLHHGPAGRDFLLDRAVLRAAADAGIRIVLLQTHYRTGGIGRPLGGGQARFDTESVERYWESVDALRAVLDPRTQSIGAVAHSVRAVPREEIVRLREEARRRNMVFHMHVEEVRGEIEDCVAAHGRRPMEMLLEDGVVDDRFTAVHCTHTDPTDMDGFVAAGGTVCLCPLTEGNLGDGVPDLPGMLRSRGRIAIGSDLNSHLDAFEELRWIEYVQRLVRMQRGVARNDDGRVAPTLLRVGTAHGAGALGLDAGAIRTGALADLVSIDLGHPTLEGWTAETLPECLVFGAGNAVIDGVWVGGRQVRGGLASD